jgi:hypothetical protein
MSSAKVVGIGVIKQQDQNPKPRREISFLVFERELLMPWHEQRERKLSRA